MGRSHSKNEKGSRSKHGKRGTTNVASNEDEYEDVELLRLRKMIQNNPESFVLNNLMMCVQFFKNYEEEIEQVKGILVSPLESELNKGLPPQKRVLLPDVLQERVDKNVKFTSARQTLRPTTEPLQPVRIFTVYDNVEIMEQNSLSHYSSMDDSIMYNIMLQTTQHEGYIQLQLITENDDEFYSDSDSIYCMKPSLKTSKQRALARSLPNLLVEEDEDEEEEEEEEETSYEKKLAVGRSKRNLRDAADTDFENGSLSYEKQINSAKNSTVSSKGEPAIGEQRRQYDKPSSRTKLQGFVNQNHTSSLSSGYRSDNYTMDSDSSYNPSQKSRLGQSSTDEGIDEGWIRNAVLPNVCFKRVTFAADGTLYDPREEKKQLANSKQRRLKEAMKRHNYDLFYASSTEFMLHFTKVFAFRLADCLGFDKESVDDIRREGCVIHCDKVMVSKTMKQSRVEQYEIMPAVWMQWPACAQEWLDRSRNTWPDPVDVEKIKLSGCYVVPEGFVPKKGDRNNLSQDLEWQLTFPAAERYLETCMTHTQVQVYLIALMLHKTFIRPVLDAMFGLTTAHIRHKLFWLIEEHDNPSKWSATRSGDCLITLLKSLYHGMSQFEPTLMDYFVRGRNLFQRIPCEHLLYTQKQLKRITENPVMYVFHAMENIRYNESFYPRLDFAKLLNILTADSLTVMNPALAWQLATSVPNTNQQIFTAEDEEKYGRTEFWKSVKDQRAKRAVRVVTNRTLISPQQAADSIIEISIRCAELEGPRLFALLDFFIQHFIKIADRCNQYGARQQKALYLDHAERLSMLLFEEPRYREHVRGLRDKINVLRKKNPRTRSQNEAPETPKRNVEAAVYVSSLKDRFARESDDPTATSASSGTEDDAKDITVAVVHEEQTSKNPSKNKSTRILPTPEASSEKSRQVKFLDSTAAPSVDSSNV
ncbi:uncharacterized protein LOC143355097 [Halictus rubicundus]|uniref:uncharacterized protein LOC143355097 n=1 Tax=Halictus rubicundus TaxID=77578 RepID=UPI0040350769